MTPAASAHRLLLGTGLGLLLASGLGLISGVLSIKTPSVGFLIPVLGFILLLLAGPTRRGEGPLSHLFPNENKDDMAGRIESELTQTKSDAEVGNAWAKLEHTMLSKELEEE
tara:strand:- start:6792 stop:7127 length:336 start_codon:yes stop_codon:yes gene_type:complete